MALSFLILDTYYSEFLKSVRRDNPEVSRLTYEKQLEFLLSLDFGTSDYYSFYLKKLGYKASDIIANDEILQRQWAKENNLNIDKASILSKLQTLPLIHRLIGRSDWIQKIVLEQIKKEKPDVLYMQDLSILNPQTLKKAKKYIKILVGQIACPLPSKENLKQFDLILTSFPHYVQKFKDMNINSEYFRIGFDSRVLQKVGKLERIYDVTFIGGISLSHTKGIRLLQSVANKIKIDIWGYGKNLLNPISKIYKQHHGEAWAMEMYKKLAQSKITINRHIDVSSNYANNMRLYEATGMGAMLITDKKDNLNELFIVGKEIVEYENAKDLIEKIKYYLKHDRERVKIALAGQKRTLSDHTYAIRMTELVKIINKYV